MSNEDKAKNLRQTGAASDSGSNKSAPLGRRLADAITQHQQGHWKKAEQLYHTLLAETPENADILHLIGILYGQIGQFDSAQEYLERALSFSADNPTFHNSMANVKKRLDDIDSAIFHYKTAIKLQPSSTTAHNNLAILMTLQGDLEQASQSAKDALALNPDDPEAHYNLAIIALKQNDTTLAVNELRATLTINPAHLQARYTLAQQLQYTDQYDIEEALEHYQAVLKAQPNFTDALVNYGAALLSLHKREEAIKNFYLALDTDPDHYEAHYNLGCALLEKEALPVALEHFIKAIVKKPTSEAYYNIGVIYSYQDRHGDALSYLKNAIELNPNYFAAYNNLATVYLKIDDIPKAIENFEAALKLQPKNAEITYILNALRQEKTPDRAPKEYVEHLFDQYAPYFDQHLQEHLKYETPQLLHEAVMANIHDNLHCRKLLDLGCGTGLAGKLFKDIAAPLIGVDLSSQMIATLEQKALYDQLIIGDIHEVLKNQKDCEVIIACDVLTYIGDLSRLFAAVEAALTPGGLFAFTTELAPETTTYTLQTSIRYAHSPSYILQMAEQNHLTSLTQQNITLRLQHNKPLPGLLTVLGKALPSQY